MNDRKSIFDLLTETYDIQNELIKIRMLFHSKLVQITKVDSYGRALQQDLEIETLVNQNFLEWKSRGTCLNCPNMRKELNVEERQVPNTKDLNEVLKYLEYYCNIVKYFIDLSTNYNIECKPNFFMLIENIDKLLDHIHHERKTFEDEEKVILVPKNAAATAVAEISSKDTAMAIVMYHHRLLKGNLEKKSSLLSNIAKEYEHLLDHGVSGFSEYFSKTKGLLNNLNIRHNNTNGKHQKDIIKNMPKEELEGWYDETYKMLLFCVLIKDNLERKDKVSDFLKTLRDSE